MQAETTKHKTVTGKILYYVRITGVGGEHLINIGERTYKKLEELKHKVKKEA